MRLTSRPSMRRRKFIQSAVITAAAWPFAASAQPQSMPVIGILTPTDPSAPFVAAFRQGLCG